MSNEKEYYDKDLEKILRTKITREKYGNFALIIEEVFQRRAYEFGFSVEQIEQEVENFVRNVNSIGFVSKEEMSGVSNAMGVYCSGESAIKINQDYFNNKFGNDFENNQLGIELYEVLTHEIYHAISDDKAIGRLGLSYWDGQKWKGNALNEICVETAADRATYSKTTEDADRYRRKTSGYSDITFVTNLLAASIGVSEKEFLKAGTQNRGKLSEVFYSKFPNMDVGNFAKNDIFDKIEANLDIIYNLNYHPDAGIDRDMKNALFKSSLISLYSNVYDLASLQIATDETKTLPEATADATYRFLKMEKIMKDSLEEFAKYGMINENDIKEIQIATYDYRNTIAKKVNALTNLNDEKYKIQDPIVLQEQFERAKQFTFYTASNIEMLSNNYGFEMVYKNIKEIEEDTKDLEYTEYVLKEDYDNGRQWDNVSLSIVLGKMYKEHMQNVFEKSSQKTEEIPIITDDMLDKKKESFFGKIKNGFKNIFTKFQNRNLKQLSGPLQIIEEEKNNNNNNNKQTNFFEQYRVSSIDHNKAKIQIHENETKDIENINRNGEEIDY